MELSPIIKTKNKMSGGTTRDTEDLTTEYTNELQFQSPTPTANNNNNSSSNSNSSGLDDVYDDEFAETAADESSSSNHLQQQQQQRNNTNTNNQISIFDAIQHLIKGNLGPGCLNIPNAFALCGWMLGSFLFLLVAIQGIYSMILLVYCKRWIRNDIIHKRKRRKEQQQQDQEQGQLESDNDNNDNDETLTTTEEDETDENNIRTFMDIAYISHGYYGSLIVQCLLFILQTGVCCVFLSLIATNLHAASIESNSNIQLNLEDCVFLISILLLGVVLIRDLKELKWLSLGANLLMILAIFTASITALSVLFYHNRDNNNDNNGDDNNDDDDNDNNEQNNEYEYNYEKAKRYTTNPAEIATFISSMFYSFEGIGLVMPIENSFVGYNTNTNTNTSNKNNNNDNNSSNNSNSNNNNNDECGDGGGVEDGCNNSNEEEEEQQQQNEQQNIRIQKFINPVLVISMSIVGCLFLLIGITCGPAFPDMHNGSVTAYLTMKYPTIVWYKVINVFVMIAIFCTFPLQLTPAMEVLNEWFGPGCDPKCCSSGSGSTNSTSSISTSTGTSNTTSASSNDTRLRGLLSIRRRRQRRRRGHTQIAQQDNNENDDDEFTTVEEEALAEEAVDEVQINSTSNNNNNSNSNSNSNSNNNNTRATNTNTTVGDGNRDDGDGNGNDGIFVMNSSSTSSTCFGQYEWIFRRYIVVFCCTIIVLSVNDLGLLMSLFGAVGNTGLAGMPCLIHLRLMKLNIAPYSCILRFIDIGTILLCTLVAITGVTFTLQEII